MHVGAFFSEGRDEMDPLKIVWENVLEEIKKQISTTAFNTWFADCEPYRLEEERIVVLTTSELKQKVLNEKFTDVIHKALFEVFSCDMILVIITQDDAKMMESRQFAANTPPEMDAYTFDSLRTRLQWQSPATPARCITRFSSTATPGLEKPTCSWRSATSFMRTIWNCL